MVMPPPPRPWSRPAWRRLPARAVSITNVLCDRGSMALDWFGQPARARIAQVRWTAVGDVPPPAQLLVRGSWRDLDGFLALSHAAAEAALAGHFDAIPWDALPPEVALALLQDGVDRLQAAPAGLVPGVLRLQSLALPDALAGRRWMVLEIHIERAGDLTSLDVWFDADRVETRHFPTADLASAAGKALVSTWGALPVVLIVELGWVTLPLGDLQTLVDGDVLLPDRCGAADLESPEPWLVCLRGAHRAFAARYDNNTHRVTVTGRQDMDIHLTEATRDGEAGAGATAMHDIPVRMTFDLGERHLTLRELASVGAGHVFDLALLPQTGVSLRVNGLRVGEGEIVEIDGRLGVVVTRIVPPRP